MRTHKIVYFDRPGGQNTDAVVEAVRERCEELRIKHVAVASNSEETALKLWEALKGMDVTLTIKPEKNSSGAQTRPHEQFLRPGDQGDNSETETEGVRYMLSTTERVSAGRMKMMWSCMRARIRRPLWSSK